MAKCSYCGETIIFGGKKDGKLVFCNQKCLEKGIVVRAGQQLPDELVREQVNAIFLGNCPKCQGHGPTDVHVSYRVWSAILFTSWGSRPQICCRTCAIKSKLIDATFCMLLGWWGLPWGLIITPIQFFRNIGGIIFSPDTNRPSDTLFSFIRAYMVSVYVREQQIQTSPTPPNHNKTRQIVVCPKCKKRNAIPSPADWTKLYRCGNCSAKLEEPLGMSMRTS